MSLRHALAGISFWACLALLFVPSLLATVLFAAAMLPAVLVGPTPPGLEELEATLLGPRVEHLRFRIKVGRSSISVHGLLARGPPGAASIVLLHGTASASTSFAPLFGTLSHTHSVYALDLPSFGRSSGLGTARMVEALEECRRALGLDCAVWGGHSFGAFVAIRYAHAHPSRVDSLVLLSPAGIFPTMGAAGAYWAVLFKFQLPNVGRWLGRFGPMLFARNSSDKELFWWRIASDPDNHGGSVVAAHVSLGLLDAHWNDPAFDQLADLDMPIGLVYGEHDAITPAHQGRVLQSLLHHHLVVISGAAHDTPAMPQVGVAIADFLTTSRPHRRPASVPRLASMGAYRSSFHTKTTVGTIERLYAELGVDLPRIVQGRSTHNFLPWTNCFPEPRNSATKRCSSLSTPTDTPTRSGTTPPPPSSHE